MGNYSSNDETMLHSVRFREKVNWSFMLPSQSLSLYIKYKDMIFSHVLRMKLPETVLLVGFLITCSGNHNTNNIFTGVL